jgi:uncharacterized protein DUF4838
MQEGLRYMSRCLLFYFTAVFTLINSYAAEISIQGTPCKGIYLTKSNATHQPYDDNAAKILQYYLQKATGKHISINYVSFPKQKVTPGMIILGQAAIKSGVADKKMFRNIKNGGFAINVNNGVVVVANSGRDNITGGVYALIEAAFGVEFLVNNRKTIITEPEIKSGRNVIFKAMNLSRSPAFKFRFIRHGEAIGYSSHMLLGDATLIGSRSDNYCHTADALVNYEKYKDSHPEYFAILADGKRMSKKANMKRFNVHFCISNPNVKKIVSEGMIKWMKSDPKAKYFWLCQGDGGGKYCRCRKCSAMPGIISDRWIAFVNDVAAIVTRKCPGRKLLTLAYVDLEKPPVKIRPAKNVIVMYAPYPNNWSNHLAAFDDKEYNGAGIKTLKGWTNITNHNLGIFCYPSSCPEPLIIWPSFYANYEKIIYYAENNAIGMDFCGLFPYGNGLSGHNSFNELQRYVLSKVLWNPSLDVEAKIDHFMRLYYGAGAKYMQSFFKLIHEQVKVDGRHYAQHTEQTKRGFVTDAFAKKAYTLFAKAEKATKSRKRYYDRIRKEKLFLLYSDLTDRCRANRKISAAEMPAYAKRLAEFAKIAKQFKIYYFGRAQTPAKWFMETAILKLKSGRWYNDPKITSLIKSPLDTLGATVPRCQEKNRAGDWIIPIAGLVGSVNLKSYNYKCPLKRDVKLLRRASSGQGYAMTYLFLEQAPSKPVSLNLEGLDNEKKSKSKIEITVNGKVIYKKTVPFAKHAWETHSFKIPTGILRKGKNKIEFKNITPDIVTNEEKKYVEFIGTRKKSYKWGWFIISGISFKI